MKTTHAMVLGLAIGASGTAWGQAAPGPIDFRELFLQLDANADTVIERDEVPEAARDAFDRLIELGDEDRDGKLQAAEMRGLGQTLRDLGGPEGGDPQQRFRTADKDGDGTLSRDEFPGPAALFDQVDADGNGLITREEAAKARGLGQSPASNGPTPERLKAMDKDGDGKVSRDEFPGPAALFDRLDTNSDGSIDSREAARRTPTGGAARPGQPGGAMMRLKAMDKDGDGKVSRDEFPGRATAFDRLDTNGDGSLDREEAAKIPASRDRRPKNP